MMVISTPREISSAGLSMLTGFENDELTAYLDEAGVWTVGFGHTPAHEGQTITREEAEELLDADLLAAETTVCQSAKNANDNQYAAMVSLCYNIGNTGFRSSTVLREHNAGNYAAAAKAFLMWDKITKDGRLVDSAGLLNRRKTEMALYEKAIAADPVVTA
jgi:lysozyme